MNSYCPYFCASFCFLFLTLFFEELLPVFLRGAAVILLERAGKVIRRAVAYRLTDFLNAHAAVFQISSGPAGLEFVDQS